MQRLVRCSASTPDTPVAKGHGARRLLDRVDARRSARRAAVARHSNTDGHQGETDGDVARGAVSSERPSVLAGRAEGACQEARRGFTQGHRPANQSQSAGERDAVAGQDLKMGHVINLP